MIEPTPRYQHIALRCLYATLIVAMVVFVLALAFWWIRRPYEPLHNYSNVKVHEISDDSGRYLVVQVTRCNREDNPVTIFTSVSVQLQSNITYAVPLGSNSRELQPGCTTGLARYNLNSNVTQGQWVLIGLDTVISSSGQIQALRWNSPVFEVRDG